MIAMTIRLPARPVYERANGARLAFVICNNIERFAFCAGLRQRHRRSEQGAD
jgi:hypothetical protein